MMNHGNSAAVARPGVGFALAAAAAAVLMVATVLGGTAGAGDVQCGDVISEDTTLTHDLGPCPGNGLIVRGDGVTLDLGGHRIFADNGPEETVGVRIGRSTGVTVQNGTVEGFDAGVEIAFGGGNTVQRITAINNINDMIEPWRFESRKGVMEQPDVVEGNVSAQRWLADMLCFYGDGITTSDSSDNVIRQNRVIGNGPYGGITLVGGSERNVVEHNTVLDSNIHNWTTRSDGNEGTGLCGATLPGAPGMQRGRRIQAIGVRIEGPGAVENVIRGNRVENSALVGVAIHSYVCNPQPGEPRPGFPNERNLITQNTVRTTGAETAHIDPFADGISSLSQGPIGRVTCTSHNNTIVGNNSSDNMRHGISLHRTVEDTVVNDNVANNNAGDGFFVAGPFTRNDGSVVGGATNNTLQGNRAHRNAGFDGNDENVECDNNSWRANRFVTVNQPCVAAGGTGWVGGPGNSGQAPGQDDAGPATGRGRA